MINQDTILAFYHQEITGEVTRLQVFAKECSETDMQSFKDACKEAVKADESLSTRVSELRQIYGATRFAGLTIEKGYHETVKQARELLKEANITWQGTKPSTEEEKQAAREARQMSQAAKEVAKTFNWNQPNAIEKHSEAVQAEFAKMQAEAKAKAEQEQIEKVSKAVDAIFSFGEDYAKALFVEMAKRLGLEETEAKPEKKKRVA